MPDSTSSDPILPVAASIQHSRWNFLCGIGRVRRSCCRRHRRRACLRRLTGTRRDCLRPNHWPSLCDPRRRQHHYAGNPRQPGVWSGRAGHQGDSGAGPQQLRRGQSGSSREGGPRTNQLSLYAHLQPDVDETDPDYKAVAKANAKIRAKLLSQASTVVSEKIKKGQLKVVAGYCDIGSGVVTLLS